MEDERDAHDAIRGLDQIEFGRKGRRLRVEWTKEERSNRRPVSSRKPSSNPRPSKTLFVINFDPYQTRSRDLERHFDRYGKVLNVRIRRNFAFIQYEEQEDATRALEATNLSKLMDRVISVEYAGKDDDQRKNGSSPDRGRDRSPGRRDYRGGRSPSPYRRVRASPSYGRARSPNQGERASPDYGHRRSSNGYHKSKDNDYHGRSPLRGGRLSPNSKDDEAAPRENSRSLSLKRERSRSPLRRGRLSPNDNGVELAPRENSLILSPKRERSRSPPRRGRPSLKYNDDEPAPRENNLILSPKRVRSRSPPRRGRPSLKYNDDEPAPRENSRSLSPKRERSRSPLRGGRLSPNDNDDEPAPRENIRSLSPKMERDRIPNDSHQSPSPDSRIEMRTSPTDYGAASPEAVGYRSQSPVEEEREERERSQS
ncbi:serine/arginine-rich splicing factor RS40-like isoform X2 [Impatiens glandulifera]|nr:serine/arginine-rich splicing factor RS40-like isoform X2 [Impatiens glandulifera]